MVAESGFIIFFGLLFIAIKLPKRVLLLILGRPLATDITVSALVYVLHWGTFTGVMAAAFAGMMTSLFTSGARWLWGYIVKVKGQEVYMPGRFHIDPKTLRKQS